MTGLGLAETLIENRSSKLSLHHCFVVVGPEPGAAIDGHMAVVGNAETATRCHALVLDLIDASDADRVFITYLARFRGGSAETLPTTLGELLQDPLVGEIHLVGVSQRVRHRVSGLEAAAALFGVFGSDYLVLGAHFLGLSPSTLVDALDRDELSSSTQKLIAAIVANARPFSEIGLIEAVERIDLMVPANVSGLDVVAPYQNDFTEE